MTTATIEKVVPKVGDILSSSWGYDQTNVDFYKVVKTTEFSVWIQKLGQKITEITGWAHEKVVPTDSSDYQVRIWDENGSTAEFETRTHSIHRHKIQYGWSNGSYGVSLTSFSSASLWDGKPEDQSHTC